MPRAPRRAQGPEPSEPADGGKVTDLMSKLEESVAAARADRQAEPEPEPDMAASVATDLFEAVDGDEWFQRLEEQTEWTNILYYGKEGTGKTTALATMGEGGRTLFISAESGVKVRALRRLGISTENLMIYPRQGQRITFEGLEQVFWRVVADLDTDPASWYGVCWDSITEISRNLLDNVRDAKVTRAEDRGLEIDRFFMDRDYYGEMSEQMRLLLRRFRDLPCHLGISALERRDQDDDGEVTYGPAVTPALQTDLLGFVDLVCHTEIRNDQFGGRFRPQGKYRAKERLAGAVPSLLINPSFQRVNAYAQDQLTVETDPEMQDYLKRREQAAADRAKEQMAKELATR